jgi:hypothetical protein
MYEELVEEFDLKKNSAEYIANQDGKLIRINKELQSAKYQIVNKKR